MAISLFHKTKQTEEHITTFLMNIMQAGYLFLQALESYMAKGCDKKFMELKNQISSLEAENDSLRRQTELNLIFKPHEFFITTFGHIAFQGL